LNTAVINELVALRFFIQTSSAAHELPSSDSLGSITIYEDGSEELLIEDGHLKALDDPGVRKVAAKYGDPDAILSEDWIPAIPGINMEGDYWQDYANDPLDWTLTELHVCQKWHNLYMKMVAPAGGTHHHAHE
jgi:hypothetical protein